MAGTGLALGASSALRPLLLIAFVGRLNPSAGDVGVLLALEHARVAAPFDGDARIGLLNTMVFTHTFRSCR